MPQVIAISGKSGTGKSTLAQILSQSLSSEGKKVRVISFARPLKAEVSRKFGIPMEILCSAKKDEQIKECFADLFLPETTYRELIHKYSEEKKKENPNYWLDKTKDLIKTFIKGKIDFVILDDLRFKHEFEFLKKEYKAILVRLDPYKEWKPKANGEHISETDLDNLTFEDWNLQYGPAKGKLKEVSDAVEIEIRQKEEKEKDEIHIFPDALIRKGERMQLARPFGEKIYMSSLIYKIHKKRQDGTVILKPFKKII